jgi:plastocyanin
VGAWSFSPPNLNIKLGQSFVAINQGGETHTFTEVEEFGGGQIPLLNDLSGNPIEAPECVEAEDIPAGAQSDPDTPDEVGVEKYQCCKHPWMRATVTVRGS